jgi:Tfp pilus assembly protein PilX
VQVTHLNNKGECRMTTNDNKQRGAVSLFIVVFAALLITIVTVSFVRIMLQDQQQASTTDLSQSAYDSAQAGVEDAKRALLLYQSICNGGGDCSATSDAYRNISSQTCNVAVETLKDVADAAAKSKSGEVNVQTGSTDNALDQAYTCVKIALDTPDYLGKLLANESNIIPLKGVGQFDTVQIQWFSGDNLGGSSISLQSGATPLLYSWPSAKPPIMRAQMMQFSNKGFTLGYFDNEDHSNNISNANTLFLYPSGDSGVAASTLLPSKNFTLDIRRTQTASAQPLPIICGNLSNNGLYACTAKLVLPTPVNVGDDRTLFLRLSALYNPTDYRVTLIDSTKVASNNGVDFNAVQPQIDSTGRANDLFRRVQTRVELTDVNFPYPEAEIDITGSFCKDFSITDSLGDYNADTLNYGYTVTSKNGQCTP